MCDMVAKRLYDAGYEVDTCYDGEEAFESVLTENYDLIVLDLNLPGMDGMEITTKTCAYTNHTIMAEALEKWPIEIFSRLLPRIYQIVEEINRRFILQIQAEFPGDNGKVARMAIVYDGQVKMAHLAIAAGYSVNGVAKLHTEILKNEQLPISTF